VISWVQAGSWHEAQDQFQPGDAERFLPIIRGHSENTYALRVTGDSMTAPYGKTYPAGCYIVVDPNKNMPCNGDRVIAKLVGSDAVTFKVYKEEDGRKWLSPLNTSHPPITEPFRIIGTVISKWEDE
jgi:SOS-response transcriptional repressor LexA